MVRYYSSPFYRMTLNISRYQLVKLEIDTDEKFLLAYRENLAPLKFSLESVTILNCSWNFLPNLPPLPEGLEELDCSGNLLTRLPLLPRGVERIVLFP